jgi:hypothetical protein
MKRDGREHRYDKAPPCGYLATLFVTVKGGLEYTTTRNVGEVGHWGLISSVKPRDNGWVKHDDGQSDKATTWRRKVVPQGQQKFCRGQWS